MESLPERNGVGILFLADTHLGFDMPARPRVQRRRRGPEFFRSFERALAPALQRRVDLVVHGGDLFYRSKVRAGLVLAVLDRIRRVTERGIPFVVVPGNHERSAVPLPLLWTVPGIHVFDRPRTFLFDLRGTRVSLSGFPHCRGDVKRVFRRSIEETGWRRAQSDVRLLCMHETVEGATVGPVGFTFRGGADVIPGGLIPAQFAAVLSGHIHRFQVLRRDLRGRELCCPVFYPGSTERTSFAERNEAKGYLTLDVRPSSAGRGSIHRWVFRELPTHPMKIFALDVGGMTRSQAEVAIRCGLASCDPHSIVRLRTRGEVSEEVLAVLRAASLRACAPASMHVEFGWQREGAAAPAAES